jgi:hypothetical protein
MKSTAALSHCRCDAATLLPLATVWGFRFFPSNLHFGGADGDAPV